MNMPMSPEHSHPVPPEVEQSLSRQATERRFVGDDMLHEIEAILPHMCEITRVTLEAGTRMLDYVRALDESLVVGEPVLFVNSSLRRLEIDSGGVVAGPLYMTRSKYGDYAVSVNVVGVADDGRQFERAINYQLTSLLYDKMHEQAHTSAIVGEYDVREALARFAEIFAVESPSAGDVERWARFLRKFKNLDLDFRYLGLSEDKRYELANALLAFTARAARIFEFEDARDALVYVAGIQTPDQLQQLDDVIKDQWVSLIEVTPQDSGTGVRRISEAMVHSGRSAWQDTSTEVLHANFVAELYERRAAEEHAPDPLFEDVALPELTVSEPPSPREVVIMGTAEHEYPSKEDVQRDVQYLRELRAAGYSVEIAVERDEASMYRAIKVLVGHVLTLEDPIARMEVFDAMEFLFGLTNDEQRDELYSLLCERFGSMLPYAENNRFKHYVGVAEAIGRLMPYPPQAQDGSVYHGRARTAAVMARMLRCRSKQAARRQLRTYRPTEEFEESSQNTDAMI